MKLEKFFHECISFDSSRQLSFQGCTREASPAAAAVTAQLVLLLLPRPSSCSLFLRRKMAGGVLGAGAGAAAAAADAADPFSSYWHRTKRSL